MTRKTKAFTALAIAAAALWTGATVSTASGPDDLPVHSVEGCATVAVTLDQPGDVVITLDNADDDWPTTTTGRQVTHLSALWPASRREMRWTITVFIDGQDTYMEGGKVECS